MILLLQRELILFVKKKIEIENNLFFITKDDKYIGVNWK